jgi:acetyl esterase
MPVDPNVELLLSAMAQGGQGGLSDLGVDQARAMIEQFDTFAAGEKPDLPRVEDLTCPGPEGDIPLRL